jgi:hypothetical protein
MFSVRCSYIEIYNEEIRDLLNYDPNTKLELREDKNKGIFAHHLKEHPVKNIGILAQLWKVAINIGLLSKLI